MGFDDSHNSWSSLEMDVSAPVSPALPAPPPHPVPVLQSVRPSAKQLKGKIQAGVQGRVNDFGRRRSDVM